MLEAKAEPRCRWCEDKLYLNPALGWVHPEGGAAMLACEQCGYQSAVSPVPLACPRCGQRRGWRRDHTARPQ